MHIRMYIEISGLNSYKEYYATIKSTKDETNNIVDLMLLYHRKHPLFKGYTIRYIKTVCEKYFHVVLSRLLIIGKQDRDSN